MDLYAEYIHKSRYARYLPARGRREHYPETVERYLTFMRNHYGEAVEPYIDEMRQAMLRRSAFPSMRAFWAAGPALERNHLTAYNCSYLSIRTPRDFAELLFISMCGTGVGFSCQERYHVSLPDVPAKLTVGEPVIVEDSREGWQDAVLAIITALFQGVYRPPDVRKVRLKGAKLKTTGGTASGPEPLIALIDHLVEVFERRAGKRLRSYDIHSICTKTGQIVQVGGVRRAAEMSLSDVDDALMRHAKDYKTQDVPEHFYMSNNSVCYDGWPGEDVFRREWAALVASGSGERGIFNLSAARRKAVIVGRLAHLIEGTNPCAEILLRDKGLCNLSEQVIRAGMTDEEFFRDCRANAIFGTLQSGLTHFPNVRPVWKKNAEEERLLGCSITGIMDYPAWAEPTEQNFARLRRGKQIIAETNAEVAKAIGINKSVCRTTIKPSGTLSKLAGCAAGMHSRFAPYYLSRATQGKHDPICKFLIDQGVPYEQSQRDPDQVYFLFPQRAPEGGRTVEHENALQQLNRWKMLAQHWAEHSVSATIYVRPNEWEMVLVWVEQHFDMITGLSFMPYCGPGPDAHVYEQAPLEVLTKEQYEELQAKMPETIDWGAFEELEDQTTGAQELACVGGACELV